MNHVYELQLWLVQNMPLVVEIYTLSIFKGVKIINYTVYSYTVGRVGLSEYSVMTLPYICHGGQPGRLCIVVQWGGWG